jgi:hypothetical protein
MFFFQKVSREDFKKSFYRDFKNAKLPNLSDNLESSYSRNIDLLMGKIDDSKKTFFVK